MPGSATMSASPSRTRTTLLADAVAGVAGVEEVDAGHRPHGTRPPALGRVRDAQRAGTRTAADPVRSRLGRDDRLTTRRPRPARRRRPHRRSRSSAGAGRGRPWRPHRRRRDGRGRRGARRPPHPGRRAARPDAPARASRTRTCTPSRPAWTACAATSRGADGATRTWRASRRTPRPTRSGRWIVGGGWSMDDFPGGTPGRERLLDAVVPDRPGLPRQPRRPRRVGEHAAPSSWRASTVDTPDPVDGRIERDADGQPPGTLHEGATDARRTTHPRADRGGLARRGAPRPGRAALARDHRLAGRRACPRRTCGGLPDPARSRGELTARVVVAQRWAARRGGCEQLDEFVERRRDRSRDRAAAGGPA